MPEIQTTLRDLWNDLSQTAQDAIIILGIILLAWMLRRLLARFFIGRLQRWARRSENNWDDLVTAVVTRPLNFVMLAALLAALVEIIEPGATIRSGIAKLSSSLLIIAFFLVAYALVTFITATSERFRRITGINTEETLLPFLRTAIRIVLIAFGLVIILNEWNYDVNGLVAGLGLGGLAFALAAQDTLANLFGFTTIVGDHPFVEGDFIKTPDVEGVVEKVGLRSTRIRQLDQAIVTVPNSKLTNAAILNWSRLSKRRINFVLGVTYNTDSRQMQELLHRIRSMLASRKYVDPESIVVYFIEFGDSALEILVRAYVLLADWGAFTAEREAINLEIMDILESLGIEVAFPSRTLYFDSHHPGEAAPKDDAITRAYLPLMLPFLQRQGHIPAQPIPQADEAGDGSNYDEMDDVDK